MNKPAPNPDEARERLRKEMTTWDGFLALGFGSGLSPIAPGTMGSLLAVPIIYMVQSLGQFSLSLILLLSFFIGVWICGRVGRRIGHCDHGAIVWDEFVGYGLTVLLSPPGWPWLLAAFVAFRIFDIAKPWPIRQLEARVKGGLGVMLDDMLAGLFAAGLLQVVHKLFFQ